MKTIYISLLLILFLIVGVHAQSNSSYLSRNSKLNRKHKVTTQKERKVKTLDKSATPSLYAGSYRSRNEKFHRTNSTKPDEPKHTKHMAYYDPSEVEKRQKKIAGHNSAGVKMTKFLTFVLLVGIIVPK